MSEAPENTRAAFDLALLSPIDGLEFDVQLTSDDRIVIHHDEHVRRTMGGRGRIGSLTFEELQQGDFGRWFSPDYRGERIPTLDDVIAAYGTRTRLLIEVKSFPADRKSGRLAALTGGVVKALSAAPESLDTFILSFEPAVLEHIRRADDTLRCVLNTDDPGGVRRRGYGKDYLFAYSTQIKKLDDALVSFARAGGQRVMTWSCNKASEVDKAVAHGVDVIMTDRPAWAVEHLATHHGRRTREEAP